MNTFQKIEALVSGMYDRPFLNNNPVLNKLEAGEMTASRAEVVVGEYVGLVTMIISYLFSASCVLDKTSAARDELIRNLGEERGSVTAGQTHHEILNRCLQKIGVNVNNHVWSKSTRDFLFVLGQAIYTKSPVYVAGVILALEATATPELMVVAKILNRYAALRNMPQLIADDVIAGTAELPKDMSDLNLDDFFAMHIEDFEPGHRDRFIGAILPALDAQEDGEKAFREFISGFTWVLDLMDAWWIKLAAK